MIRPKPLVLAVWVLCCTPAFAQTSPPADDSLKQRAPSILDSRRKTEPAAPKQQDVAPPLEENAREVKSVEARPPAPPAPFASQSILQSRPRTSIEDSRERVGRVRGPDAVKRKTSEADPLDPLKPEAASAVATDPAPMPANPVAAAPVDAAPSIVDSLPKERREALAPKKPSSQGRTAVQSVPLKEAEALAVPDVNIPLIDFRRRPEVSTLNGAPVDASPAVPESGSPAEPVAVDNTTVVPPADNPVAAGPNPSPSTAPPMAPPPGNASLLDAFANAKANSPAYRAAEATRDANLTESTIARLAFLPVGNVGVTQSELESSTRKTARITMPLFSLSALASYREADPRELLALANFRVQENTLATEVFRVTSSLMRAIEQERLNQANIETLEQQARFAEQAYREGQGTITDLRDTQVRLNQALANRINSVNQRVNAEQEYRNLIGEPPLRQALQMSVGFKDIAIAPVEQYLERADTGNPGYVAATQQIKISELSILKSKGAVTPTVAASAIASERNGMRTDNIGVTVSIPIAAQDYLGISVAKDKHRAMLENYRGIELNTRLLVRQLQSAAASGRIEVAVRTDAISSAELSVQANQKSYLGGVRTQIEVLNSLQTLYDTQIQQINARLNLAQNVLRLELESGSDPTVALATVQKLLF